MNFTPIETAVAIALYTFNMDATTRAQNIYRQFNGESMEVDDLINVFLHSPSTIILELPYASAKVYVNDALVKYGLEAKERCLIEEQGFDALFNNTEE